MLANGTVRINGYDLPRTMVEGYKNTIGADLHGNCTWIMSYPGSTLDDEKHSATFIEWQKTIVKNPASVNRKSFVATAYPGTAMFTHPKVRARLTEGFGLNWDDAGQPVCDDALLAYTLELDDATKVMHDKYARPIFYGDTTEDMFLKIREMANNGDTAGILNL